jgi:hypothetical protein
MSLINETISLNTTTSVSSIVVVLNLIQQRFISQLPLITTILGITGFIGNCFTFLQPTLRSNSCCIYTLCGSLVDIINLFVNLLPIYLSPAVQNLATSISNSFICKIKLFVLVFLPQLSMNLLITSLIDRYACTYSLTSPMHHLPQVKMVPWMVIITVIISCIVSLYSPILYDIIPGYGCGSTYPTTDAVFYIVIHGIMTPVVMIVFVLLTYRRFKQNRQRVVSLFLTLFDFLKITDVSF